MRIFIQSPDGAKQIDGSVNDNLLKHLPNRVGSRYEADVVVIPISMYHNYTFNDELVHITQPIAIIDFIEYEWNYWSETSDTHLLGKNTHSCRWLAKDSWYQFDNWVASKRVVMYLKRELAKKDVTDNVKPIEWACYLPGGHLHSKDEFNSRRMEVFNCWGYSNPARADLHADIFKGINTHGLGVIAQFDHYDTYFAHERARAWMSVYAPHWSRRNILDNMRFQENAKLTVSLPGAGQKCFRSTEAPVSSIMAMQQDDLAWSYDWTHGVNCIRFNKGNAFPELEAATHRDDLYDIYMGSLETVDKYRSQRYANEYVYPLIKNAL